MTNGIINYSKLWGEFYTKNFNDCFDYGQLVKIYYNHSIRLFTIDKKGQLFKVHQTDFGTIFFNKEEFRSQKINNILN